jgi:Predicted transmembrane transcriptional regulator (anti-sigma factor)
MEAASSISSHECPLADISAYIDGELSPQHEVEIEKHFAGCSVCTDELNIQKKILCAISSSLENEHEIELPKNFTKVVVANAESRVSGLRRPNERYNAIFICCGLLLFCLFALGADAGRFFETTLQLFDKVGAVGAFAVHVVYDFAIGAVIILRCVSSQFWPNSVFSLVLPGVFAVSLFILSRLVLLHRS